jgi:protein-S-isoprenylcysteine O-methyltransferase Ste14
LYFPIIFAIQKNKTMKAAQANLLNAFVLLAAGLYGYFMILTPEGTRAITALIPAAFGLIFLILQKGVAAENKIIAHVVVVLTLLLLIICTMRFLKIEDWGAKKYLFLACIVSNTVALVAFIGSFIAARKNRQ